MRFAVSPRFLITLSAVGAIFPQDCEARRCEAAILDSLPLVRPSDGQADLKAALGHARRLMNRIRRDFRLNARVSPARTGNATLSHRYYKPLTSESRHLPAQIAETLNEVLELGERILEKEGDCPFVFRAKVYEGRDEILKALARVASATTRTFFRLPAWMELIRSLVSDSIEFETEIASLKYDTEICELSDHPIQTDEFSFSRVALANKTHMSAFLFPNPRVADELTLAVFYYQGPVDDNG